MEKEDYITLFNSWLAQDENTIVFLLNRKREVVGALYLNTIRNNLPDFGGLAISENNGDEKFYIYINGVGVFFTYFNKGDK